MIQRMIEEAETIPFANSKRLLNAKNFRFSNESSGDSQMLPLFMKNNYEEVNSMASLVRCQVQKKMKIRFLGIVMISFILVLMLTILMYLLLNRFSQDLLNELLNLSITSDQSYEKSLTNNDTLYFTLARKGYDPLPYFSPTSSSILTYEILKNYTAVIEPYANMSLVLLDSSIENVYYEYSICDSNDVGHCYDGLYHPGTNDDLSVAIDCSPHSDYIIYVNEISSSTDEIVRTNEGMGKCLYVRREIRSLRGLDLERTMDAMFTIWSVNEMEGQRLFGPKYHSSTFLLEFHYFNAAWRDSDHIHEGNGFLPQHIKLSNIFEESIQSVDPSVTIPFWDFTIESSLNMSVMLSPIFTDEMFGSMPRPVDQYLGWTYKNDSLNAAAVQDSRWAFIKADLNDRYQDLNYGFGYLRAPWNMNPSRYMSRFTSTNKELPSCKSHLELLKSDTLGDFLYSAPYAAHAATHGTIGGVYGCDAMDSMREKGYLIDLEGQINLCKDWVFYMKEFFRLNYITPKKNCSYVETSVGTYDFECGYDCNEELSDEFVFQLKSILNSNNDCVPYALPESGWEAWKDFICKGDGYKIFGGDHLESASPGDPSFWPIHPTLERLLQAKYMSGTFSNLEWPKNAKKDYVCDKSYCYDDELGFGYWDDCCYGHYEYDQMLDAASGSRYQGYGLTNKHIHDATNPAYANYSMSYIYSDFNWNHCENIGQSFSQYLTGEES